MNPKELMIGNLVYLIDRSNKVHLPVEIPKKIVEIGCTTVRVTRYDVNFVEEYGASRVSCSDLSTIPLTVEWLIRFGFEKTEREIDYFGEGTVIHAKDGIVINQFLELDGFEDSKIEYVHQLQNLYQAIMKKELVLKCTLEKPNAADYKSTYDCTFHNYKWKEYYLKAIEKYNEVDGKGMKVVVKYKAYAGYSFFNKDRYFISNIEDLFLIREDKVKGKIICLGVHSFQEHGFSGVEERYSFIDTNFKQHSLEDGDIFYTEDEIKLYNFKI